MVYSLFRWLRRHCFPGHCRNLRSGDKHLEERHTTKFGSVGARVGRVLPARTAARARRAGARRQVSPTRAHRAAQRRGRAPRPARVLRRRRRAHG